MQCIAMLHLKNMKKIKVEKYDVLGEQIQHRQNIADAELTRMQSESTSVVQTSRG